MGSKAVQVLRFLFLSVQPCCRAGSVGESRVLMNWKRKILAICLAAAVPLSAYGSAAAQAAPDSYRRTWCKTATSPMTKPPVLYMESGGAVSSFEVQEEILLTSRIWAWWSTPQLYYDGFGLETGGVYRFAFDARSTSTARSVRPAQRRDYHAYIGNSSADPVTRHFDFGF